MRFFPEILPAHPFAPEDFPPRTEAPRRWSGTLADRRSRREMRLMRKLRYMCT